MIQLIYAHPYPQRSRANSILLEAVRHLPGLEVRVLYDLYPDFAIDIDAEQRALLQAHVIVWQHPMYWYSVPPLLKLWFDKVLAHGWAYGEGAAALADIVGRLLFASRVRATVLDHDPDQIELLRKFGFRVFYGDATRTDLLEAAGAAKARVLVNAIDDVNDNLALVDTVRHHFPNLKIISRARNVTHYYELRARGVALPEREIFEASLMAGRRTLEALGVAPYEARERTDRFRRHNVAMLEDLLAHAGDETRRVSMVKAARDELEAQFEQDRAALDRLGTAGWHEEREAAGEARAADRS